MGPAGIDVHRTRANDEPEAASGRPFIFIVYENHEHVVAHALKDLLESWGFDAFFCRQEIREQAVSEPYRRDLAEKLAKADLVILVLSTAFAHSQYCQAETGATVTMRKRHIDILIPPVDQDHIKRISPVVEGWDLVDGGRPEDVVADLREKLAGVRQFRSLGLPAQRDPETASRCDRAVEAAVAQVVRAYRAEPPSRALIGVWPSLKDRPTRDSIVERIRRAVAEGETNVAVVGVSLKYSLDILSEAVEDLTADGSLVPKGPLTIELVHMDDQAHILYSLKDVIDIDAVVKYLRVGWPERKARWETACGNVGIAVNVTEPVAIDYIPQQVGVRVESVKGRWSALYAGRCSFDPAGIETRLLVGEREYFFYTSSPRDPRGPEAIEVFNWYFDEYRSPRHNGATLVRDHNDWITRLEACVSQYPAVSELVLVSNTGQKLFQLIEPALRRGLPVRFYTRNPDRLAARDAANVRWLEERIADEVLSRFRSGCPGRIELRHFNETPTFRSVIIGNSVLGLQAYTVQANSRRAAEPAPLLSAADMRLIVTRHSEHFDDLQDMVYAMLHGAAADADPYAVLGGLEPPE